MNERAKVRIEAEIDAETYGILHELAEAAGQTDAAFISEALTQAAAREAEFIASLEEAEREIEAGHFLTQDEMERWYEARCASRSNG